MWRITHARLPGEFDLGIDLSNIGVVKKQRETDASATGAGSAREVPVSATVSATGSVTAERGTRARVARLLLENGPSTASALSEWLGITPTAVRRHLDALLTEGMVAVREDRPRSKRGRGRPARLFAVTDAGRNVFYHAYDDLASAALRFLAETVGEDAVADFAREQVSDLERRYRPAVGAAPTRERVQVLAEALSGDGYAAAAQAAPSSAGGEQLCQHHCPVAHVAEEFPQLCEAETEVFERLLGTPVQRLATIAHGDGVCTTHVTSPALADGARREERTQEAGSVREDSFKRTASRRTRK